MPKQKTSSTAKKRFKMRASGLIKRNKQNKRHILTKKSSKRKMRLRKGTHVSKSDEKMVKSLITA